MFTKSFGRSVLIHSETNEHPLSCALVRGAILSPEVYAPFNLASKSQPMIYNTGAPRVGMGLKLSLLTSLVRNNVMRFTSVGQIYK